MTTVVRIAVLLALPAGLAAQSRDTTGTIAGTVFDSVARAPVAGALVQVVPVVDVNARIRSTVTDARGAFSIEGLAPGRYLAGFQHEALDSLALQSPERRVDVQAGRRVRVDLAVPSPGTIRSAFCGMRGAADSSGVLLGRIRDAGTGAMRDSGSVELQWQDIVLEAGALKLEPQVRRTTLGPEGWFVLCDVPGGSDIGGLATSGADSTGLVTLTLPVAGIARRDFLVGGSGTVRGVIVSREGGRPTRARVGVAGRAHRADADSAGRFVLRDIPAGSLTLDVRALGYAPEPLRLDLRSGADTSLTIRLTSLQRILDTIRVVGQRVYDRDRSGFLRRQRAGMGSYLDENTIARSRATDFFQLLRRWPIHVEERRSVRYVLIRDRRGGYCMPSVFVDGSRMYREMAGDLDAFVHPDDLAGVELYRGIQAPGEFMDPGGCGSVVIWTRRNRPRPVRQDPPPH